MNTLEALLAGIVSDPLEETRWLVLADWLEEFDDPCRAELLRLHRKLIAICCEPEQHPERTQWQTRMVQLIAAGVTPCVPQKTVSLPPGDVSMTFSFIPPGSFRMGSDHQDGSEDESPVHKVTLTKGFFLGIHTVNQAQWKAVMGTQASSFQDPNQPVETVSWENAQEFCAKLSASLNGEMTIRLPTEAEWEYACRAGTTSEYHFGDVINTDIVNYDGEYTWNGSPKGKYRQETTEVGSFPANAWGLHDVHGNVWEWCEDWFAPYSTEDRTDPRQIELYSDEYRVLRGGAWYSHPGNCRAAYRAADSPTDRDEACGFRVCFRLD